MKEKSNNKLTSINIDEYLYKQFKKTAIELDTNLTKVVAETLHKFVSSSNILIESGSI